MPPRLRPVLMLVVAAALTLGLSGRWLDPWLLGLAAGLDGWLRLRDWLDRRGARARTLHAARARR